MPKLDTKEVKRLNEQFRVWEERFPDVSKAIKAHARTMGVEDVSKGNSFALSRANMSTSDISTTIIRITSTTPIPPSSLMNFFIFVNIALPPFFTTT